MKFLRPLFLYASMLAVAAFTVPWSGLVAIAGQTVQATTASEPGLIAYIVSDTQRAILAAFFIIVAVITFIALVLHVRSTKPDFDWLSPWRQPSPDRSPPD